jgi:Cys-tRNA(Pro)/Cys-tRNA(Cys) deacylase
MNPFGQTRKIPAVIEEHALEHDLVYVNGGKRGLRVIQRTASKLG